MDKLSPEIQTALYVTGAVAVTGLLAYFYTKNAHASEFSPNPSNPAEWEPSPTLEPGQIYEIAMFCPDDLSQATCGDRGALTKNLEARGFRNVKILFVFSDNNFAWPTSIPKPSNIDLLDDMIVFMGLWNGAPNTHIDARNSMMPMRWKGNSSTGVSGPAQIGMGACGGGCGSNCGGCKCGSSMSSGSKQAAKAEARTKQTALGARTKQTVLGARTKQTYVDNLRGYHGQGNNPW